ncbi:MAG: DUF6884 domain-containing protein [Thermomicrobiales bacterium]
MTTIGLVACGKGKLDHPAPAHLLYNGALFRKASAYCEDHYDRWAILSARHGLILPETEIAPYDLSLRHLTAAEQQVWAARVLEQFAALGIAEPRVVLHAAERYARHLEEPLGAERPLRGLGIGRQLAWYVARGY